jgi:hypothetical protein
LREEEESDEGARAAAGAVNSAGTLECAGLLVRRPFPKKPARSYSIFTTVE